MVGLPIGKKNFSLVGGAEVLNYSKVIYIAMAIMQFHVSSNSYIEVHVYVHYVHTLGLWPVHVND